MRTTSSGLIDTQSNLSLVWLICAALILPLAPQAVAQTDRGDPCAVAPAFEATSLFINGEARQISDPQNLLIALRPGDVFELTLSASLPDGCTEEGLVIDLAEGALPQFVSASKAGDDCGGAGVMFPADGGEGETPLEVSLCGMPDANDFLIDAGSYQISMAARVNGTNDTNTSLFITILILDCGDEISFNAFDTTVLISPESGGSRVTTDLLGDLWQLHMFPSESILMDLDFTLDCLGASIVQFDIVDPPVTPYQQSFPCTLGGGSSPTLPCFVDIVSVTGISSSGAAIVLSSPVFPLELDDFEALPAWPPNDVLIGIRIEGLASPSTLDLGNNLISFRAMDSTGHVSDPQLNFLILGCYEPPQIRVSNVNVNGFAIPFDSEYNPQAQNGLFGQIFVSPGQPLSFDVGAFFETDCLGASLTLDLDDDLGDPLPDFLTASVPLPATGLPDDDVMIQISGTPDFGNVSQTPYIIRFEATDSTGRTSILLLLVHVIEDCGPYTCEFTPLLSPSDEYDFDVIPGERVLMRVCATADACPDYEPSVVSGHLPPGADFILEPSGVCGVLDWTPNEADIGQYFVFMDAGSSTGVPPCGPIRIRVRAFDDPFPYDESDSIIDLDSGSFTTSGFGDDLAMLRPNGDVETRLNQGLDTSGDPVFSQPSAVIPGDPAQTALSLTIEDITQTGLSDFVVVSNLDTPSPAGSISVTPGDGAGGAIVSDQVEVRLPGLHFIATDTGDLDNDKDLDLAGLLVGDAIDNAFGVRNPVVVFRNAGLNSGQWLGIEDPAQSLDPIILAAGDRPAGLAVADLNMDGLEDIIVTADGGPPPLGDDTDLGEPASLKIFLADSQSLSGSVFLDPIQIMIPDLACSNDSIRNSVFITHALSPLAGDFDGDQDTDLILTFERCQVMLFYRNAGVENQTWLGLDGPEIIELAGCSPIGFTPIQTRRMDGAGSDLLVLSEGLVQPDSGCDVLYLNALFPGDSVAVRSTESIGGNPIAVVGGDFDQAGREDFIAFSFQESIKSRGELVSNMLEFKSDAKSSLFSPSDLTQDGSVSLNDLSILLELFGQLTPFADLNEDGRVDTADLGIMIRAFGAPGSS